MPVDEWRERFAASPIARLATADAGGRPHLVPMVFACSTGEQTDRIYSAVDAKPKTTRRLKRLTNIAANPAVSVLVDHYDGDWQRLWWVRADGVARVVTEGPEFTDALAALAAKYPQYREAAPAGPVIVIAVTAWRGWAGG